VRCIGGGVVSVDERQKHQDRHQAETGAGDIVTMFSDADGGKACEAIPLADERFAQHLAELEVEEEEMSSGYAKWSHVKARGRAGTSEQVRLAARRGSPGTR